MPWVLASSYNQAVGTKVDTGVPISTGQWVAVVNQAWTVGQVQGWGVIQTCPALPSLFGGRTVLDQHFCYNLEEVVYGSAGIGSGGRVVLYVYDLKGRLTIPVSIYRWT